MPLAKALQVFTEVRGERKRELRHVECRDEGEELACQPCLMDVPDDARCGRCGELIPLRGDAPGGGRRRVE